VHLPPPPPFLNLLSPCPYCLSNSTDYWWYWLSSTDCLKLFPQTHTWGSALATGGPSSQHCTYWVDNLFCWHPQQCQHAQTPTLVCLSRILLWPCRAAEMSGFTSTTSLSYGPRIFYHFTHLAHFTLLLTCSGPLVHHTA